MSAAGPLPPASAALLSELQPQAFVDSGFVSKYLQTNLELGRVLLANLLGLEMHDLLLERYVKVALYTVQLYSYTARALCSTMQHYTRYTLHTTSLRQGRRCGRAAQAESGRREHKHRKHREHREHRGPLDLGRQARQARAADPATEEHPGATPRQPAPCGL